MDNSKELANHFQILREELLRPSVKYQQALKISRDGNKYCVLLGENLMDGVAGFGSTLLQALDNFDANMEKPIETLLRKDQVQDLVYSAGKDTEDVFEYLNGLEVIEDGKTFYKCVDVIRYINR